MFKYLKQIESPKDKFFLSLMILALCERTIFVFPILYALRIIGAESLYDAVMTLIYIVLVFGAISQKRIRYITGWSLFVIFFFFSFILYTFAFHLECSSFLAEGWKHELKPVIPWFLLGTCFFADEISMETIGKWCSFGVVFLSWYLLISNNQLGETSGEYDMGASYRLLLSTLITINYAFHSKNKWAIGASVIGVFYAFAMGTRGPVLVIIVFILLLIAQRILAKGKNKFWIILLVGAGIAAFTTIGTTPVLLYLQELLESLGFSTRVFDMALEENVLQSHSRQMIYDTLWAKIIENPMPHGLYAEKLLGFFSAHNLYIDALFTFGVFIGSILLLVLVLLPLVSYRRSVNPLAKEWILMFSCLVFIHGIFGSRFMSCNVFFLLGFSLKELIFYSKKRIR